MIKEKKDKDLKSKQVKWVCPNNCGTTRTLNPGVTLAICQNPKCNLVGLVPFGQKISQSLRASKPMKKFEGLICSQCGKKATSLTPIGQQWGRKSSIELCYSCLPKGGQL